MQDATDVTGSSPNAEPVADIVQSGLAPVKH